MKNLIIVLLALVIGSCKQNAEPEMKTAPAQSETKSKVAPSSDLNETADQSIVVFEDEKFGLVYENYLALKAALVNTDNDTSAGAARLFFMAVKGNEEYSNLLNSAIAVSEATVVEERRVAFESVTIAMEVQLASQKIVSGTIYKQYCPMAFDGKGAYWLSDSKEVRNPYYGDKMLKCGVVDKEIN